MSQLADGQNTLTSVPWPPLLQRRQIGEEMASDCLSSSVDQRQSNLGHTPLTLSMTLRASQLIRFGWAAGTPYDDVARLLNPVTRGTSHLDDTEWLTTITQSCSSSFGYQSVVSLLPAQHDTANL